jgi:SAM-dependent methyltransferase
VLNPAFSAEADEAYGRSYVLPPELRSSITGANQQFDTGAELRLQDVYGDELWSRLRRLGLGDLDWPSLRVLDACCGTGFLAYHLLSHAAPRSMTLLDVSADELASAERLVAGIHEVRTIEADLAGATAPQEAYDIVVGNSFLHHFPDVPAALDALRRLVVPGGWVVGLHEPTLAAVAWESGDLRAMGGFGFVPRRWLRRIRLASGEPVRPGTTDVWLFRPADIERLLAEAGFVDIRVQRRYFLRPLLVSALGLHLCERRPRLRHWEVAALNVAVWLDDRLCRWLPERLSGGVCFAARRPNER